MARLFTKSAFTTALECPRRLCYLNNSGYANQDLNDEFLMQLAEGGFQVGELAKVYYGIRGKYSIGTLDEEEALECTATLFQEQNANIAEAAFRSGNLFVRTDIIEKKGDLVNLVEVKAKSWAPDSDSFLDRKNTGTHRKYRAYLYDIAFQKYVVAKTLKEKYPDRNFRVKAYLMMADKSRISETDGLNQMFAILKDGDRTYIDTDSSVWSTVAGTNSDKWLLTPLDVDSICDRIIAGEMAEQQDGSGFMEISSPIQPGASKFEEFVKEMADIYCNRHNARIHLGSMCFKCPFHKLPGDDSDKKDGYRECWTEAAGFQQDDFDRPLLKDLPAQFFGPQRNRLIGQRKYFLDDISLDDLGMSRAGDTGPLNIMTRRCLQTAIATDRTQTLPHWLQENIKDNVYLDIAGLAREMGSWKYPLHFIDFETSTAALPFYRGMHPYEPVAFQFSHHIVESEASGQYSIRHAGQYLHIEKGHFPNFDFVRELKRQLSSDDGTIFRYSHHENTILRAIYEQLKQSEESDREELMEFIDGITHNDGHSGHRDMVDLAEAVVKFYFHPSMKGSYSIKKVLPAVLNSSEFIREKYSVPIYGSDDIPSLNWKQGKAWIDYEDDGRTVRNPYELLPSIAAYLNLDNDSEQVLSREDDDMQIANGGAALAAYTRLQFSDVRLVPALEKALKVYCELDTLAMVFIWEYFHNPVQSYKKSHKLYF